MLKTAFEKLFQMRENASRARVGADEGFDAHEKPFLDHLEDLRSTLMKIGATLAISTIACFAFHTQIYDLIKIPAKMPLAQISDGVMLWDRLDLITLSPPEFIILMLKMSFFSGVILTFPFTVYFLFQFILPGLRQVEKKAIIPGAAVGFVLFLVGVAFAFFLAAPVALKFFYVFENQRISNIDPVKEAMKKPVAEFTLIGVDGEIFAPPKESKETEKPKGKGSALTPEMRSEIREMIRGSFATVEASNIALRYDEGREKLVVVETKGGRSIYRIGEYINFITRLMLVFGISFQLPVIVTILVKLELLTARVMRATRTYAWIIILVAAAILTPPDLMTLGLLGGPMIFLYEICILIASMLERSREKKELAKEEENRSRLEKLYMKPSDELTEEEKAEIHQAEIEQYEKEHAHLYDAESEHGEDGTVARDSLHGGADASHDHQHDESWHADDHYWHDGHEDDPHHGMESDHAEPEELNQEGAADSGEKAGDPTPQDDIFVDDDACAPSGPIVDLNHATLEELISLPGVGPKMAEAIIDHRPYETFDDVEIVPGLGPKKLNGMIDRLMLG